MPVQELLPETISINSHSDRSGYVGGVVFGNQYFYISSSKDENILLEEIKKIQEELSKKTFN